MLFRSERQEGAVHTLEDNHHVGDRAGTTRVRGNQCDSIGANLSVSVSGVGLGGGSNAITEIPGIGNGLGAGGEIGEITGRPSFTGLLLAKSATGAAGVGVRVTSIEADNGSGMTAF